MQRDNFPQGDVIDNYNRLAKALKEVGIELDNLNEEGICAGLALNYLLYAKGNQRDDFQLYLNVIRLFTDEFINQCQEAEKNKKNLWKLRIKIPKIDKDNKPIPNEWISFSFEKLIRFMEGIQSAHRKQFFKGIGANWDRNVSFISSETNLAKCLKKAKIANGQFMIFGMGFHKFALERTSSGFYLFEPNAIKKSIMLIPLRNENEVAEVIMGNIKNDRNLTSNKNVGFTICFLSYGNVNSEVDDAIQTFKNKKQQLVEIYSELSIWPDALRLLVDEYRTGKLSRVDFAVEMCEQIEKNFRDDFLLMKFHNQLKKCLYDKHTHDQDEILSSNQKMINQTAYYADTAWLYLAAEYNQIDLVKKLLAKGADLDVENDKSKTPLYIAAKNGHASVVALLINAGADFNKPTNAGATPLYIASQEGHASVVRLLVNAGADLNIPTNTGATPLYIASQEGDTSVVALLVNAGADLNKPTNTGATPLYIAAQQGHASVVALLANAGADLNKSTNKTLTPLFISARNGDIAIVKILLTAGVDENLGYKSSKKSLSDFAKEHHVQDSMDQLIQFKLTSGQSPSEITVTPLEIATVMGHDNIVALLTDYTKAKASERENKLRQHFELFPPAAFKSSNIGQDKESSQVQFKLEKK